MEPTFWCLFSNWYTYAIGTDIHLQINQPWCRIQFREKRVFLKVWNCSHILSENVPLALSVRNKISFFFFVFQDSIFYLGILNWDFKIFLIQAGILDERSIWKLCRVSSKTSLTSWVFPHTLISCPILYTAICEKLIPSRFKFPGAH